MTDPKKDAVDGLLEFILSDDRPVGPEDQSDIDLFNNAQAATEKKLARPKREPSTSHNAN